MRKIIKILLIVIVLMSFLMTVCYGASVSVDNLKGNQKSLKDTDLVATGNVVIKVISTIGVVVSVIVLIIIGIKYMLGSVGEKAEYKKTLFPYIIGAILVFAASAIAQIIYNIANNL